MGKVFSQDTKQKEQTILFVRDDKIRKDGMGMTTALAFDSGYRNLVIYSCSLDKINKISFVETVKDAVVLGMAKGTFFHGKGIVLHERGKQRF